MKLLILASALLACGSACAAEPAAAAPSIDTFIKHTQFRDAKISPNGEYLAASVMATEDTGALVVLNMADMKLLGTFKLRGKSLVDDFDWVNPTRLVFSVADSDGSKTNPRPSGELYGMDANGKNQVLLVGPRKEGGMGGADSNLRAGFLLDEIHDDDKFALVMLGGVGNDEGDYPRIGRMNVDTGRISVMTRAPVLNADFLTDHEQRPRFAWGEHTDNRLRTFYRAPKGGDWELINDENVTSERITPLAFSRDGGTVYLDVTKATGPNAIEAWDVATRARKLVVRDDNVDPLALLETFDGKQPYAVMFMDGLPRIHAIDATVPEFTLRKQLAASFPGTWISFTSSTRDQNKVVFRVSSDRNPGDYYLFDRTSKKATYLLSARKWIDPEQMAAVTPISFKARDGLELHGLLTLPPGSEGKNLPLVLNPHGGPIGPFDAWGFNWEAQLFASRGYAVLQVNYRGSGNYGLAFERSGYRQWGDKMIDDMTDAVNWAAGQGIVDRERICIYGASYGGYAAAQAIVREPNMYKCSVGYVGVYDMPMMYTYGDIPDRDAGTNFLGEALGGGKEFLAGISPTRHADKIRTPMFIVVGNDDVRAHPKHSRAMRDALEKAGQTVEWMEKEYEGHGYFKEENNRELYTRMLAFFDRYIGPGAKATAAADGAH